MLGRVAIRWLDTSSRFPPRFRSPTSHRCTAASRRDVGARAIRQGRRRSRGSPIEEMSATRRSGATSVCPVAVRAPSELANDRQADASRRRTTTGSSHRTAHPAGPWTLRPRTSAPSTPRPSQEIRTDRVGAHTHEAARSDTWQPKRPNPPASVLLPCDARQVVGATTANPSRELRFSCSHPRRHSGVNARSSTGAFRRSRANRIPSSAPRVRNTAPIKCGSTWDSPSHIRDDALNQSDGRTAPETTSSIGHLTCRGPFPAPDNPPVASSRPLGLGPLRRPKITAPRRPSGRTQPAVDGCLFSDRRGGLLDRRCPISPRHRRGLS